MKRLSLVIILAGLLVFSCSKKKECGAFENNDLKYIPYSSGDILKFENTQGDLFKITIGDFLKSEPYDYKCNDIDGVCPCIDSVNVYAKDSKNSSSYIFLKLEQSDASEMQYFKYLVKDFYFEFDFRNELPHIGDFDHIELINSMDISGTTFTSVIVYTNTFDDSSDISKVYFNESNGILMFSEKSSGEVWSIKN